ncbi:hypothetical protein T459_27858 [Capsicum annuum]|uniref:Endonuclease/exonuclease/phosphatase domain-containing protein n=1 Tax=Capsicum annuum TaxID=4072 RepID=A0A2G2YFL6_CAPAN|nr:hypothetical protein T459_27858 [Capsicum annuum]
MKSLTESFIRRVCVHARMCDYIPAWGSTTRMLFLWVNRKVEEVEVNGGKFMLAAQFRNIGSETEWGFEGIYGPVGEGSRESFGEELGDALRMWDIPWMLSGDFITNRFPNERTRGKVVSRVMEKFSKFIDYHSLVDLPLRGAFYTWSRSEDSSSRSRLNRFLVSTSLGELVCNVIQIPLLRLVSDHSPFLLDCNKGNRGRSPSRFENMWLRVDDFKDRVGSDGAAMRWRGGLLSDLPKS